MKNLNEQIQELEEVANCKISITKKRYIKHDLAVDLCRDMAKKALAIIKHLQAEVDKYKTLWEADAAQANEIIIELESKIKKLEENDKR